MITELIVAGIFLIETFHLQNISFLNNTVCKKRHQLMIHFVQWTLRQMLDGLPWLRAALVLQGNHWEFQVLSITSNFLELVHSVVCWWVSTKYQVKGTFPKVTFMFSRLLLDNKMFQAGFLWERGYWQKHAGKSQSPGKKSDRTIWS